MKFSITKENPATTEPTAPILDLAPLRKELADNEKTRVLTWPEERDLIAQVSGLQDRRMRLSGYRYGDDELLSSARVEMAAIDRDLPSLKRRLAEIEPAGQALRKRCAEIRLILVSELRLAAKRTVEKAATEAPSLAEFRQEKQKLQDLTRRLSEAEENYEKARTATQAKVDRGSRAADLLKSGTIPQAGNSSTPEELRRAMENVEIFKEAIEIQGQIVSSLRADYVGELQKALKPACVALVRRVANGYREAQEAALDGELLQDATKEETDGQGLVSFGFYGVSAVYPGAGGPFSEWLARMQREYGV
jgi:hypothetical protein